MRYAVFGVSTLAALASLDACTSKPTAETDNTKRDASLTSADASRDGAAAASNASAPVDAGKGEPKAMAAANFQTSVVDGPAWPESNVGTHRLGYLRNGAVVKAYDRPIANEDCTDGWYELETGGYVCGKATTFDLASPRVRLAPKQPDRDAGMPYRYGVSVADGTPLYRRVLAEGDRKKFEHGKSDEKDEKDEKDGKSAKERSASAKEAPPKEADKEETPVAAGEEEAPPPSTAPASGASSGGSRREAREGREPREGKDERDAGSGKPKLRDLKGRGVLVRKLARGFHLGLDREFRAAGTKWWRTTFGFAVPYDRVALTPSVAKHTGSWFTGGPDLLDGDGGTIAIPDGGTTSAIGAVGFFSYDGAHKIEIDADRTKAGWGEALPKRAAVGLTGRETSVAGVTYHETLNGFWVRVGDVRIAKPEPPADLADGEKWIDIDLTRQTLIAFEGKKPVFATLISSGRRNPQDKEHDFPTPTGTFRIREKHITTTMDGDVASDGPYSIEDVPWVMYFQGSYAIHGAFWHDAFGNPRSHGCVNISPDDARALFGWADPPLPESWHGVYAPDDKHGTRIVIHEDRPKRRHRAE